MANLLLLQSSEAEKAFSPPDQEGFCTWTLPGTKPTDHIIGWHYRRLRDHALSFLISPLRPCCSLSNVQYIVKKKFALAEKSRDVPSCFGDNMMCKQEIRSMERVSAQCVLFSTHYPNYHNSRSSRVKIFSVNQKPIMVCYLTSFKSNIVGPTCHHIRDICPENPDLDLGQFNVIHDQSSWCQSIVHRWFLFDFHWHSHCICHHFRNSRRAVLMTLK